MLKIKQQPSVNSHQSAVSSQQSSVNSQQSTVNSQQTFCYGSQTVHAPHLHAGNHSQKFASISLGGPTGV
ncbi:hypothetical protein QUA86_13075 [Microcoleus sp. F6_B6]